MIAIWPATIRALPGRGGWDGGPRDERAVFEPESGPPLLRRRVTGVTEEFAATFPNLRAAEIAAFESWYEADLAGGALPFLFRDPVRGDVGKWLVAPGGGRPYGYRARGADLHDLSLTLLRLPGRPAIAPYVRVDDASHLRAPRVVADYDAGIFLIDASGVPASEVALVAGTYDVLTVTGPGPGADAWELARKLVAGDIPSAAPPGVARILAFLP